MTTIPARQQLGLFEIFSLAKVAGRCLEVGGTRNGPQHPLFIVLNDERVLGHPMLPGRVPSNPRGSQPPRRILNGPVKQSKLPSASIIPFSTQPEQFQFAS